MYWNSCIISVPSIVPSLYIVMDIIGANIHATVLLNENLECGKILIVIDYILLDNHLSSIKIELYNKYIVGPGEMVQSVKLTIKAQNPSLNSQHLPKNKNYYINI